MNAERAGARPLPAPADLKPAPVDTRPTASSLHATTLFAVLLITVSVWLSFIHFAQGGKVNGDNLVTAVTANQQARMDPAASGNRASPDKTTEETSTPASPAAASPQPSEAKPQLSTDATRSGTRPAPAAALPVPIAVTARNYRVPSGENFAEIRVHRSTRPQGETAFLWWTEPASAKPGVDYVPQGKVMQVFPKGKTSTSFFVKLVPTASRTQPEVFYIAIAEAGRGGSSGQVTRAAVWLPTTHDHSYAMATHGG
jgi:hypothetical protein